MPTGVSVSHTGRIFVNFPKWGDEVPATVVELRDRREVPFPDQAWNQPARDDDAGAFVSVQSIVVDPADRLWVLDTGSPMFRPTQPGGPKLVRVDLDSNLPASTPDRSYCAEPPGVTGIETATLSFTAGSRDLRASRTRRPWTGDTGTGAVDGGGA